MGNENKKAAHEEVEQLRSLFQDKISKVRGTMAEDFASAKHDLSESVGKMYEDMADAQLEQLYANEEAAARINTYSKESMAAIAASKKDFETRLDTLTNVVAANHNKVEKDFEVLTGVIRDYKEAGEKDRELIKDQNAAMAADMQKAITQAIQKGEAEANAVAQRARSHLAAEKQSMLIEITNTVEETADQLFKTVQGKHQNIADNYLSLKAYAISAETKVVAYVGQGKGKNLSSLGDLLVNCAALSSVEAGAAEGLSPSDSLPAIFTADRVKIDNKVSNQRSRERVRQPGERCSYALAYGSRQVPPAQARGLHVREGCPSGGQGC